MPTRHLIWGLILVTCTAAGSLLIAEPAAAAPPGQPTDWQRFYYYPYVYYPQNFQGKVEYDHLYHRYPVERQIPVYNKDWNNFYPSKRPYHWGHHFVLDVF